MAVIASRFLRQSLEVHDRLRQGLGYPFFDPACRKYEALRAVSVDGIAVTRALDGFGLTEYEWRRSRGAFGSHGVAGLIGLDCDTLLETLDLETERMVFVLKQARSSIPATKIVTILKGFGIVVPLGLMRRLYASYGWALGTRPYSSVDFISVNLKVMRLEQLRSEPIQRASFLCNKDRLQVLLEVFRSLDERGVTGRYPGSRTSFSHHKAEFLNLGLLGLVDKARPHFRNSKLGFAEEGRIVLSKIQKPQREASWYVRLLRYKGIQVDITCIGKIFSRWKVESFESAFRGEIERLSTDAQEGPGMPLETPPQAAPIAPDEAFTNFVMHLDGREEPLAHPGVFLFLPYLHQLGVFDAASRMLNLAPAKSYSWFSLLVLNLARIFRAVPSVSRTCMLHELSIPLSTGLVDIPCADTVLNGLAAIDETELLLLRKQLTAAALRQGLVQGRQLAFDFKMRDFTGEDVALKNIGKGPSPKRKICFPGFRPHLAWDVATGVPVTLEFRNGRARATTTIKRFFRELLSDALGDTKVEHVYLDSEYTAEHVWQFIVDPEIGLGADLTMCVKQNARVKKRIHAFLDSGPDWRYYDDGHTYTKQTFEMPITGVGRSLQCVLKRKESNGRLRCFGSTLPGLDSAGVLREYSNRWSIENGIKDLVASYFFDNIPGIDPHRVNLHYFVVTLARLLFQMLCLDLGDYARNPDQTCKTLSTLRPEFIAGVNASLTRRGNELVVAWKDKVSEHQHEVMSTFFDKLNPRARQPLPFLGGLRLRFEPPPLRTRDLRNRVRRKSVDFQTSA